MGVRGEGLFGSSVSVSAGEELSRRACGALCREDRSYTITPVGHCAGRTGVTPSYLWGTVQAGEGLHHHTCGALCRQERGYTITPVGHCAGSSAIVASPVLGKQGGTICVISGPSLV